MDRKSLKNILFCAEYRNDYFRLTRYMLTISIEFTLLSTFILIVSTFCRHGEARQTGCWYGPSCPGYLDNENMRTRWPEIGEEAWNVSNEDTLRFEGNLYATKSNDAWEIKEICIYFMCYELKGFFFAFLRSFLWRIFYIKSFFTTNDLWTLENFSSWYMGYSVTFDTFIFFSIFILN